MIEYKIDFKFCDTEYSKDEFLCELYRNMKELKIKNLKTKYEKNISKCKYHKNCENQKLTLKVNYSNFH